MKEYIKDFLPNDRSVRILDIGCGEGQTLQLLTENGYKNYVGVDIDRRAVETCRQKGLNAEHITDLAQYLSGHRQEFGIINMKEAIYYFPDDKMAEYLKRIKDALRDGGRLIVEVFNGALLTGAVFQYKDYKIRHIFTEYGLKRLLEDSGFAVTHLFGTVIKGGTLKRTVWKFFRFLWICILRLIYMLELGSGDDRPKLWSKLIVAIAVKR